MSFMMMYVVFLFVGVFYIMFRVYVNFVDVFFEVVFV